MIITFHHLANLFEYPTRGCHVWQLRQSSCISRQWIPAWNDPEIGEDIAYHTHSTVLGSFKMFQGFGTDWFWWQVCVFASERMVLWLHSFKLLTFLHWNPRPRPQHIRLAAVLLSSVSRDGHAWRVEENCGWNHVTRCSRYVICIRLFPWFILLSMFHDG